MLSRELNIDDLPGCLSTSLAAIPTAPGRIGWQAAAASLLESAAFKPGNVHPAAGFDDLQHDDFVAAALAIARPFDALHQQQPGSHAGEPPPLGRVILEAVTAATTATRSNANLGIVLAMAPLAAAAMPLEAHLPQVLASLDRSDAEAVWQAIAIAQPGGLGRAAKHDLAGPPPANILEAMRLARDRDAIARLWSDDYAPLFCHDAREPGMVPLLEDALTAGLPAAAAIERAFLDHLACHPDSLIRRRHGEAVAADVSREAAAIRRRPRVDQPAAIRRFDARLRAGQLRDGRLRPINPGTTADLVAAALFVLLRRGWSLGGSAVTINHHQPTSNIQHPLTPRNPAMPLQPSSTYQVRLRKAVHVFSAGHFITLNDTLCEPIHGHNWTVAVDVAGPLDAHGMVVDFIALRDAVTAIVQSLDHRMLLPTANPLLEVSQATGPGGNEEITIRFQERRWVFPADECMLLPIVNTTAELLADWIGQQLINRVQTAGTPLPGRLAVEVDECLGQSGGWQAS